jgi:hypothetical protein
MSIQKRTAQARRDADTLRKIMIAVQSADGSDYHTSAAELDYLWQDGDTIKGIFPPFGSRDRFPLPLGITSKVTPPRIGAPCGLKSLPRFEGVVSDVNGDTCTCRRPDGTLRAFFWRFPDRLNDQMDWIGKPLG